MKNTSTELEDGEYIAHDGVWLTVKGFSIRVQPTDEGVCVDVYRLDKEDQGSFASTYAFDSWCNEDEDD